MFRPGPPSGPSQRATPNLDGCSQHRSWYCWPWAVEYKAPQAAPLEVGQDPNFWVTPVPLQLRHQVSESAGRPCQRTADQGSSLCLSCLAARLLLGVPRPQSLPHLLRLGVPAMATTQRLYFPSQENGKTGANLAYLNRCAECRRPPNGKGGAFRDNAYTGKRPLFAIPAPPPSL